MTARAGADAPQDGEGDDDSELGPNWESQGAAFDPPGSVRNCWRRHLARELDDQVRVGDRSPTARWVEHGKPIGDDGGGEHDTRREHVAARGDNGGVVTSNGGEV